MDANNDPQFWARAKAHLVRYGGAFSPLIAESAAGNYFTDADGRKILARNHGHGAGQRIRIAHAGAHQRQREEEGGDVARHRIAGQTDDHLLGSLFWAGGDQQRLARLDRDFPEGDLRAPIGQRGLDEVMIADRRAARGDEENMAQLAMGMRFDRPFAGA